MTLEELKAVRFRYLKALYDETGGSLEHRCVWSELGAQLGLHEGLTRNIVNYLLNEELIEQRDLGGGILITHAGVCEVEAALTHPEEATNYFPPLNIIQIESMVNSSIQQASPAGVQIIEARSDYSRDLLDLLGKISSLVDELELDRQTKIDLEAELGTLKAQMSSSKPKRVIINESLSTVRSILEGIAGNLATSELLQQIARLMS